MIDITDMFKAIAMSIMDDTINQYFIDNNIPYKKNIEIIRKYGRHIEASGALQYVIPGAIVHVLHWDNLEYREKYKIEGIQKKIQSILTLMPKNYVLVVLVKKIEMCTLIDDEPDENLKFITNIDQIKEFINYENIFYYCDHAGLIRSLVSEKFNDYDKTVRLMKGKLTFNEYDYHRAIAIMNDDEIERLKKYDFIVAPDRDLKDGEICIKIKNTENKIGNKNCVNTDEGKKQLFNIFYHDINIFGLGEEIRLPIRIINGITKANVDGKIYWCGGKFEKKKN